MGVCVCQEDNSKESVFSWKHMPLLTEPFAFAVPLNAQEAKKLLGLKTKATS